MTVICAPCEVGMSLLDEASVDAIVTDPPYELGFMGKSWDSTGIANSVSMWREALRVLKPGGHLLAFGGNRTYHRMVCAIEDAGFEIRDQIGWAYATGFPKSLDVSKAIDKMRIEDAEPIRVVCRAIRSAMDVAGLKSRDLTPLFGNCHPRLIDHWAARDTDSQPALPTWEQWVSLRTVLRMAGCLDAEVRRLNDRKGSAGDAWQTAKVIGRHKGDTPGFGEHRFSVRDDSIREATEAAKQWDGWGTALKPAWEPIVVARKPLIDTVAANVMAHGTGAINIDGCRIPTTDSLNGGTYSGSLRDPGEQRCLENRNRKRGIGEFVQPEGRWPANLIHDGSDEVLALFPQSKGQQGSTTGAETSSKTANTFGQFAGRTPSEPRNDTGSAARFFYCAKAGAADRGDGNTHPTVKPTDLMRYLCRLVTPPGGLVLDPFTGSGSTGKAAKLEGFRFMGFEKDTEYAEIARRRIG